MTQAVRPRRPGEAQIDLFNYKLAHAAMLSGARDLADLARRLRVGTDLLSTERARGLATYVRVMTEEIHRHHSLEDDVVWPVIAASAGAAVDLAPLTSDHDELDPIMRRLTWAANALRDEPLHVTGLETLATDSARLRDLLEEHIGEEEREVFPVMLEHVSVEDFTRVEKVVTKALPVKDLWFLLPWLISVLSEKEIADRMNDTPIQTKVIYLLFRGKYARLHRLVFG